MLRCEKWSAPSQNRIQDEIHRYWSLNSQVRVSRTRSRKWIFAKKVKVNERVIGHPHELVSEGAQIEITLSESDRRSIEVRRLEFDPSTATLYQDHAVWLVNKPAGLATQPTQDPDRSNLYDILSGSTPSGYLGLHHRLDSDTSGLILFSLQKKANPSLAEQFQNRRISKRYLVLCEAHREKQKTWVEVGESFVYRSRLVKQRTRSGKIKVRTVEQGGQEAVTEFRLLARKGRLLLWMAEPKTGRTHQLRAQLAHLAHPIMGDRLYGNPVEECELFLHALELEFQHPLKSRKKIRVRSKIPDKFLEKFPELENLKTSL